MSQQNVERAKEGIAAIQDAYASDDIMPWRQQVEKLFDPEVVLETGTEAFTEGSGAATREPSGSWRTRWRC